MMFINRKPKTLLIWAIILLALITLMSYQTDPSTNTDDFAPYTEKEHKVHQTGSYMDHVNFRLTENPLITWELTVHSDYFHISFRNNFMSPLFLLGMYVGKKAGYLRSVNIYLLSKIWFATGLFSLQLKS